VVIDAAKGRDALETAQRRRLHLILMNIVMPETDGLEGDLVAVSAEVVAAVVRHGRTGVAWRGRNRIASCPWTTSDYCWKRSGTRMALA